MSESQSIRSWFPILNWSKTPNFGQCHNYITYNEFLSNYFRCPDIKRLASNLYQALEDKQKASIRFVGAPGAGKTTFIYSLIKQASEENDSVLDEYVFYVFHADRADDEVNYRSLVQEELIRAWGKYYLSCGHDESFKHICDQDQGIKGKLVCLTQYFRDNKKEFDKTLVFIVDDVDLLDGEMAYNIALSVEKDLGIASVLKWITIRPRTLQKYSAAMKRFLDEKFPTIYNLPNTQLYDIIGHRIKSVAAGKPKNPFSRSLCDETLASIFSGNKRAALCALRGILEDIPPKAVPKTNSEEFIQNYIQTAAINFLLDKDHVPNLHDEYYRSVSWYPVPQDLVQFCQYSQDIDILRGALNDAALLRSRSSDYFSKLGRKFEIRHSDLDFSISRLVEDGVLSQKDKGHISLTLKGKVIAKYASGEHYYLRCKKSINPLDIDEKYWALVAARVDHKKIMATLLTWEDMHRRS